MYHCCSYHIADASSGRWGAKLRSCINGAWKLNQHSLKLSWLPVQPATEAEAAAASLPSSSSYLAEAGTSIQAPTSSAVTVSIMKFSKKTIFFLPLSCVATEKINRARAKFYPFVAGPHQPCGGKLAPKHSQAQPEPWTRGGSLYQPTNFCQQRQGVPCDKPYVCGVVQQPGGVFSSSCWLVKYVHEDLHGWFLGVCGCMCAFLMFKFEQKSPSKTKALSGVVSIANLTSRSLLAYWQAIYSEMLWIQWVH